MDIIKRTVKKTSNVVSVYLKGKDLEDLEYLRERNVNVSMVCRQAIRETAQKLMRGGDISDGQDNLVVECDGKVIIDMKENKITFENQTPFFNKEEFKID